MPERTCSEPGCEKALRCRERCALHYDRWRRSTTREERARPKPTRDERFDAKTRRDGDCLIWTGARDPRGYGRFGGEGGGTVFAHRFALERHLGRPIATGMLVCHTCDTPSCVNAEHLYEGTDQDNVDDMTRQARHAWGERNGHRKLTLAQVAQIRRLATQGISQGVMAEMFKVNPSTISRVVNAKRWALAV